MHLIMWSFPLPCGQPELQNPCPPGTPACIWGLVVVYGPPRPRRGHRELLLTREFKVELGVAQTE